MNSLDVYDFDYLQGTGVQAQQEAAAAVADTSSLTTVGTQTQVVGFDASGLPVAINVAGDGNGAGLSVSAGTLTATLPQNLQTTGSPTFANLTINSTGTQILAVISATATLDFPNTLAQTSSDLTITVAGAAVGDAVFLGTPATPDANSCFTGWVSAADQVTIRFSNYSAIAIDPASATYRAVVFKF